VLEGGSSDEAQKKYVEAVRRMAVVQVRQPLGCSPPMPLVYCITKQQAYSSSRLVAAADKQCIRQKVCTCLHQATLLAITGYVGGSGAAATSPKLGAAPC
jgi:hypothetical protein